MITGEEIAQLPEHPELAFVEFEKIFRERTSEKVAAAEEHSEVAQYYSNTSTRCRRQRIGTKIDGLKDREVPKVSNLSNAWEEYRQFTQDLDFFTMQIRIRHAGGIERIQGPRWQDESKNSMALCRKSELCSIKRRFQRKNEIYSQAFAWVYLGVCTVIGEGFNKLEPVRRFINSIATLIGNAKEAEDSLRGLPYPTKQLGPPRKPLPAPQPDEEESF